MKLVVGLGNPGIRYNHTRHNIGFMVVDKLAHDGHTKTIAWRKEQKFKALIYQTADLILVKPQTYMNLSGETVKAISHYYQIHGENIIVIHDDIDLPLGKIRIRLGGASAGHNGIESIINHLKTDKFIRVRLGVGRGKLAQAGNTDQNLKRQKVADYVLSRFRLSEAGDMRKLVKYGADAVRTYLDYGLEKAMNEYN